MQLNSIDVHSSMEQKSAGYAFSLLLPHAATEVLKLNKLTKQEIVSPSKVICNRLSLINWSQSQIQNKNQNPIDKLASSARECVFALQWPSN